MFLRAKNDDPEARARIAVIDQRIEVLQASIGTSPGPENAHVRLELAGILCWRGHYRATHELVEALITDEYPQDVVFEARQLIGDNHFRHDQYDLASKQYHENLERAKKAGDDYWCARAEDGIAWVLIDVGHYTTGEFVEADRIFEKQLPIHRRLGSRMGEAMGVYGLSRAAAGMGEYGPAIEYARQSIEILGENSGQFLLQLPLLQIANVHRDRGNFDLARPLYEEAIDAADRSPDPYCQVLAALNYGMLLCFVNETDAAIGLWRSVLETVKELDFPRLGHEVCSRLALIAAEQGDFEEAYRLQLARQEYGNRVGVMSSILHNQQMLLRDQMHRSAQLEGTLNYLRAGIEASVDGIFVLEKPEGAIDRNEFLIHFLNDSAAAMLGKKPVHVLHVLVNTAWRTSSAERLLGPSLTVFETGEPCTLDPIELEFTENAARCYSVKIARIPTGVVWTVSDVTDREVMQREIVAQRDRLSNANDRLTALDREKSEMMGIAAHDLRSPIGNIRSICELISTDDPDSVGFLKTIEEISNSLLVLIENLLDVERIERGELDLELQELEAGSLAAQLVEQFSAEAGQKGIPLQFEGAEAALAIKADESALRRILQNLISNALKFSPSGSPVSIRAFPAGSSVRIEIQDRGRGITESDRKKLFSKFARLSARPTGGESSTGLGLSIVKRLVEAMNGRVGCDSEPGQGATFWVEFSAVSSAATGNLQVA